MARIPASAAAIVCTLMAACGGGDGGGTTGGSACSEARERRFVLDTTREWYLFRELLPDGVDADQYTTAADLLDALTAEARAEGMDRFFSYVTTRQADDAALQEGQFVGLGFRSHIENGRLWLTDVYEGSPAAGGGPLRGTQITHVDSGAASCRWRPCSRRIPTSRSHSARPRKASSGACASCRLAARPIEAVFTKAV